jgi:signal transduction histidine kinase
VDFHGSGLESARLPLDIETVLYRITQEALTNILRHAHAKRVSVLLERRTEKVSLIVEDDGVGFEMETALQAPGKRNKLGLLGMQERVRLAGGTLDIESTPGSGTTLYIRLPLGADAPTEPKA